MCRDNMQTRSLPVRFETRQAENGAPVIAGYFSVFNSDYVLWEDATEQVAPGAFANSLARDDIRALVNHDTTLVLGRTSVGTLTLREDEHGLYGEITVNAADTDAMNLYARVQRGDVSQCSFGFDIVSEEFIQDPNGKACRWILKEVRLYEVSVVTFPAYEATEVTARKRDFADIKKRQLECWKNEMMEELRSWH